MLARAQRLTTAEEFRRTTRQGRRAGNGALVMHLQVPSADESASAATRRVGFVVGRTVGNAVVRNRTKRRLRECAREQIGRLPAGARLVVRALPSAATTDFARLRRDFDGLLGRVLAAAAPGGRISAGR